MVRKGKKPPDINALITNLTQRINELESKNILYTKDALVKDNAYKKAKTIRDGKIAKVDAEVIVKEAGMIAARCTFNAHLRKSNASMDTRNAVNNIIKSFGDAYHVVYINSTPAEITYFAARTANSEAGAVYNANSDAYEVSRIAYNAASNTDTAANDAFSDALTKYIDASAVFNTAEATYGAACIAYSDAISVQSDVDDILSDVISVHSDAITINDTACVVTIDYRDALCALGNACIDMSSDELILSEQIAEYSIALKDLNIALENKRVVEIEANAAYMVAIKDFD